MVLTLAGCKTVSQSNKKLCQVGVSFSVDASINSRNVINFEELQAKVKKKYAFISLNSQSLELELVKAYVRPNGLILTATAVVASKSRVDDSLTYYRASNVDANLANLDGEHQSALNE
ncbi:MAG: hypothetical protein JKY10_09235, partial [Cohaesibacteraceae bacterium]|nr:hypothetical protein [Cohaesibacteraceae bacterium]